MSEERPTNQECCCDSLADLAIIPMGGDGLDQRVFASLARVKTHGGDRWWLWTSSCRSCGQGWMVAQDERIYDNYYLRRLEPSTLGRIIEEGQWPDEFLAYEHVLSLGQTAGRPWTFQDPSSPALVDTAMDLRRERPDISADDVARLLSIPLADAERMLRLR